MPGARDAASVSTAASSASYVLRSSPASSRGEEQAESPAASASAATPLQIRRLILSLPRRRWLLSFPRRAGLDRQRMDPLAHQLAERGIDFALPLDPVQAGECGTFDGQREMAFAARVVAGVADMLLALVLEIEPGRQQ